MSEITENRNAPIAEADAVKISLEEALAFGVRLHQTGKLPEAEIVYRSILELDPEQVETLNFLGVLLHRGGATEEAVTLVEKAVALRPDYVDAVNNLGNLRRAQKHWDEAIACYERALALAPDHVDSLNNLGVVLKAQRRYEEAAQALQRAIELDPSRGDAYYNLGNLFDRQKRRDEAIAAYRRAIELMPKIVGAYDALARALYREGRIDEARQVYELLRENVPENPIAPHMLAACAGRDAPPRASDEYIQATFDTFSETFDVVLENLNYQAPQRLGELLAKALPPPPLQLEVLDAGCGTGLCGPVLRPYARRLVGVDLSAGMLARSRARGVYDELTQAELTDFLERQGDAFNVIASADTLVYFGDLERVLAAATGALRSGGRLFFSLEHAVEGAADLGFRLEPHGRYCHREDYVRATMERAGLIVEELIPVSLRNEGGNPAPGLVVAGRKP